MENTCGREGQQGVPEGGRREDSDPQGDQQLTPLLSLELSNFLKSA